MNDIEPTILTTIDLKDLYDRAVTEYDQGFLKGLEGDSDTTVQRILNEIIVRSNDNRRS